MTVIAQYLCHRSRLGYSICSQVARSVRAQETSLPSRVPDNAGGNGRNDQA
jgi:hypothetical protein